MRRFKVFLSAILAGISIAIGGIAFLSSESKVIGALFFTVGLFTICSFGFHLFTGKVCYAPENDGRYALDLVFIWLGNLAGAILTSLALRLTRVAPALIERAQALCEAKLSDHLISIFFLAFFCNLLIFIAVDGYKSLDSALGRHLALFFGVTVFILCGFEHCVANMFYFALAGSYTLQTLGYLLVMTCGNALGGISLFLLKRFCTKKA